MTVTLQYYKHNNLVFLTFKCNFFSSYFRNYIDMSDRQQLCSSSILDSPTSNVFESLSTLPGASKEPSLAENVDSRFPMSTASKILIWIIMIINPLTALDELIRSKTMVTCSGYSASYRHFRQKQTSCF